MAKQREERKKKCEQRRETRDDKNVERNRTDMRGQQIKEQTACHPTVTSHNLLCSGP